MSNPAHRVEIITSVQRRRRWTASEKVRMVEETFEPGMTVSLVARRHGVAPNPTVHVAVREQAGREASPTTRRPPRVLKKGVLARYFALRRGQEDQRS